MSEEDHINRRVLIERLDGNYELFRELAELFISNRKDLVAPLEKAIAERNGAAIGKAAHTIKGAVANFSANGAFDAAYELEKIGKNQEIERINDAMDRLLRELENMTRALTLLMKKGSF
ncbi:MAG: Hpt domain-containing protein [Spirochaetes bacterium]|nr:Hpt domain-containing protein [Spirochaetota bacterium]